MKTLTDEDFEEDEDSPQAIYCPMCIKRGYSIPLGGKILIGNEPRPKDYSNWLQCPSCYWLCPINEAYEEMKARMKNANETKKQKQSFKEGW